MYPSLHVDTIAKVTAEEFLKSRLDVDVDWLELSLYLAVTLSREELVKLGLGDITHTRANVGGRSPGITTKEVIDRGEDTVSLFN